MITSCKTVEIDDGLVPEAYLSLAKKLEGVYQGHFDGIPGELTLSLEGNKPRLQFVNDQGEDMLNHVYKGYCTSSFGDLKNVSFEEGKNGYVLKNLTFGFDPGGNCRILVDGRLVAIKVNQVNGTRSLDLTLLRYFENWDTCPFLDLYEEPYPPGSNCGNEKIPRYLKGHFEIKVTASSN